MREIEAVRISGSSGSKTRLFKDDHFELDGGVLPQLEVSVPKLAPLDLTLGDPEEPLRSL